MGSIRNLSDRDTRHIMDVLRKEITKFGFGSKQIDIQRFMGKDDLKFTLTVRNNEIPKDSFINRMKSVLRG